MRKHRTRIECPSLPPLAQHRGQREPSPAQSPEPQSNSRHGYLPGRDVEQTRSDSYPLTVTVRVLYFSQDGEPADYGAKHVIQANSIDTVGELLAKARSAAGVSSGRLLFRMKPLKDKKATLDECKVSSEPSALHLLLSRTARTPDVEKNAAEEAAKLAEHTAAAAAASDPGTKKKKKLSAEDIAVMKSKAKAELGGGAALKGNATPSSSSPEPAIAALKARASHSKSSSQQFKEERSEPSRAGSKKDPFDEGKMDKMLNDADGFSATAQNFLKGTLSGPLKARKVEMDEGKVRSLLDEADVFNSTALNFLNGTLSAK